MRQREQLEASASIVVGQGLDPVCGLPRSIPGLAASYSWEPRE